MPTIYRGGPFFGSTTNQALSSHALDKMLSGRFYSPDINVAKSYAKLSNFPSVVKQMKIPSSVLDQAYNFKSRLHGFPTKTFADINMNPKVVVATKKMLENYKPTVNWGATLGSNINQGLGFLKNNALRSLSVLGSLPLQAGIMTLAPTTANPDEAGMTAEDFRNLAIQQRNLSQHRNIPGTPIVPVGAEAYGHSRGVTDTGGYSGPPTRSFDPGAAQPQRPTQPGGFTNPGRGSYGPWMSHGGLAGILEV